MIGLHDWALLSLLDSTLVSIYRETQRNYGLSKYGILCSHCRADNGSGAVTDKPLSENSRWRALRETKRVFLCVEGLWAPLGWGVLLLALVNVLCAFFHPQGTGAREPAQSWSKTPPLSDLSASASRMPPSLAPCVLPVAET